MGIETDVGTVFPATVIDQTPAAEMNIQTIAWVAGCDTDVMTDDVADLYGAVRIETTLGVEIDHQCASHGWRGDQGGLRDAAAGQQAQAEQGGEGGGVFAIAMHVYGFRVATINGWTLADACALASVIGNSYRASSPPRECGAAVLARTPLLQMLPQGSNIDTRRADMPGL